LKICLETEDLVPDVGEPSVISEEGLLKTSAGRAGKTEGVRGGDLDFDGGTRQVKQKRRKKTRWGKKRWEPAGV